MKLKNHIIKKVLFLTGFFIFSGSCFSQQKKLTVNDTITKIITPASGDSTKIKKHSPRGAAIRSAIFPGLGQIYNKKYWKLPIVYGGMGTCVGIFLHNLHGYQDARFAYTVVYNMRVNHTDSAKFAQINPVLQPFGEETLRYYRNQFRRDIDYSALVFLLLWGLNVVDATVDAHLKTFDVSPDLGLRMKIGYSDISKTNGISLILGFRNNQAK